MSNETDTPRTDAAIVTVECDDSCCAIFVKTPDGKDWTGELVTDECAKSLERELSDAHAREPLLQTRLWKSEGYVRVLEARESRLREALVEARRGVGCAWQDALALGAYDPAQFYREIDELIAAALAESPSVPSCIRCGEKLTGVMALTATLCGLCADDELNAAQSPTSTGAGNES